VEGTITRACTFEVFQVSHGYRLSFYRFLEEYASHNFKDLRCWKNS